MCKEGEEREDEGNTEEENNGYVVFKIKYTESIATNDFYA